MQTLGKEIPKEVAYILHCKPNMVCAMEDKQQSATGRNNQLSCSLIDT